jgi:tetraacyldisaccharide 4'-kinase
VNPLLLLLSLLFGCFVFLRAILYRLGILTSHRLPGVVISVGNIVVGGTGKTPFTIALAKALVEKGYHPAILSRGYRSGLAKNQSMILRDTKILARRNISDSDQCFADEALMQSAYLPEVPVVVGADRVSGAKMLLREFQPTHWILDDGFQHWQIKRDIDIVIDDQSSKFLLPLGRLREPRWSLSRADVIVSESSLDSLPVEKLRLRLERQFSPLRQIAGPAVDPMTLSLLAIAGIAKPKAFLDQLQRMKITPAATIVGPDHARHDFRKILNLIQSSKLGGIVTTEKDYWREPQAFIETRSAVFVLPMIAKITTYAANASPAAASSTDSWLELLLGQSKKPSV